MYEDLIEELKLKVENKCKQTIGYVRLCDPISTSPYPKSPSMKVFEQGLHVGIQFSFEELVKHIENVERQ